MRACRGLLVLAVLCLVWVAHVGAAADREAAPFVVGCNLPWLDGKMGWDIGDHAEWGVGFDAESARAHFADMQRMGVSVVRWWLFADCRAGIVFDASGAPTGVQPEVFDRLDFIMDELCPQYGIQMYWCLLSSLKDTGHTGIITDVATRRAYIENVVTPVAERYGAHPSLFAFDLMNEPEADVAARNGNGNGTRTGTDWATMRAFLSECASAVHTASLGARVSVGSGWRGFDNVRAGLYGGLGLDFYDIHLYMDYTGPPSVASLDLDLPCLIGEYNVTRATAGDPRRQADIVARFLAGAEEAGYMGTLLWSYDHPATESPFGLLRPDGAWKPVAKVMRDHSRR